MKKRKANTMNKDQTNKTLHQRVNTIFYRYIPIKKQDKKEKRNNM